MSLLRKRFNGDRVASGDAGCIYDLGVLWLVHLLALGLDVSVNLGEETYHQHDRIFAEKRVVVGVYP